MDVDLNGVTTGLILMVGIAALCAGFLITSKLRYAYLRALSSITVKLGAWLVRLWRWLIGSGNRNNRVLATFAIVLLAVSIFNIGVMALGDTQLARIPASMWKDIRLSVKNMNCNIKGNINSSGEHIYHTLESPYYYKTTINRRYGERWFCTVQEAEAAGWRAPYPAPF